MDQKYNTSFIPKKFLGDNVGGGSTGTQFTKRHSVMGPGYYVTILLFILALSGCGGVFAYTKLTQNNIDTLIDDLKKQTETLDVAEVELLLQLDRRISSATELLNKHVAVSALLSLLEEKTLQSVRYMTFEFASGDNLGFTVAGETSDFKQVALQAKQFQASDLLHAPTVTSLGYSEESEKNVVEFKIDVGVDPRLTSYSNILQNRAATQKNVPQVTPPSPTQPTPEAPTVKTQ